MSESGSEAPAGDPAVSTLSTTGAARGPVGAERLRHDGAFRADAAGYLAVNALLIVIWAVADGHALFWPFFPLVGWGVVLAGHAITAQTTIDRRGRDQAEAEKAERAGPQ